MATSMACATWAGCSIAPSPSSLLRNFQEGGVAFERARLSSVFLSCIAKERPTSLLRSQIPVLGREILNYILVGLLNCVV